MNNRQRRRLVVAGTLVGGLLPLLLSIDLSYWQSVREADDLRHDYASVALERAELIFRNADTILRSLAGKVDSRCDVKTQETLNRAVYDSLYFRIAGLVQNGALRCTGDGVPKQPPPLRLPDPLPAPGAAVAIAAPDSILPGDPSIVALYSVQRDLALYLLISPAQLGETLQPLISAREVSVRILGDNGTGLAQFGWRIDPRRGVPSGMQSTMLESKIFPIHVVATTSPSWARRIWEHSLLLYAGVGLAISGLLLFFSNRLLLGQFSMSAELRDALANNEFEVHYQPVIDIRSGACVGAEALLRWNHPVRGLVMPQTFIPIAEDSGLAVPLTEWVMQRVVDEMSALLAANAGVHISINLSSRHILDPRLLKAIRRIFSDDVTPQRIIFEITEQQLLHGDHGALLEMVQQLRASGAQVSLDDFGTGYSSLKYLSQFQFDFLKIDKAFIDAIGVDSVTAGLVDVIVDIARRLQMKVIAEGIETPEQLDYVRQLDVTMVQGWLFSKAVPASLFREYVNRNRAEINDAAA